MDKTDKLSELVAHEIGTLKHRLAKLEAKANHYMDKETRWEAALFAMQALMLDPTKKNLTKRVLVLEAFEYADEMIIELED